MSAPVPLHLGDVVGVLAPTNPDLNKKYFVIEYLSPERLVLRSENGVDYSLRMEDGVLQDRSISEVRVVDKATDPGYARQHGLVPGTWVNIQFGGDVPMIVVGEIVGLDEDMIDVKTFPENKHIYIDFKYQGIPNELDITDIAVRSEPQGAKQAAPVVEVEVQSTTPTDSTPQSQVLEAPLEPDDDDPSSTPLPVLDMSDQIAEGDIVYGQDLGSIIQEVEVSDKQRKYPLEAQLNDMLDDILASIPQEKRSIRRMAEVQTMLERYKELRKEFSTFDDSGVVKGAIVRSAQFRPLINSLEKLENVPTWILPVTRNIKKVYNVEGEPPYSDVAVLSLLKQIEDEAEALENYRTATADEDGENTYARMLRETRPYSTPYENIPSTEVLGSVPTHKPITSVVNNLGSEESSVFKDGCCLEKQRFVTQTHAGADDALVPADSLPGGAAFKRQAVTAPDEAGVVGFLTFPPAVAARTVKSRPAAVIADKMDAAQLPAKLESLLVRSAPVETETVSEFGMPDAAFASAAHLTAFELDEDLFVDEERYKKFLESSVPFIKDAITIMAPYAKQKLDYTGVVSLLQAFSVTPDDITYRQYNRLSQILHQNIVAYRKLLASKRNAYDKFARIHNSAFARYREPFRLPADLLNNYGIAAKTLPLEILADAIRVDGGRAFLMAIGETSAHSYVDPQQIAANALTDLQDTSPETKGCTERSIARVYRSMGDLESDKNPVFATERDPTDYSLIEKVRDSDDKYTSLLDVLESIDPSYAVSGQDFMAREARAIVDGERKVIKGEYAVLAEPGKPIAYYTWSGAEWIAAPDTRPVDFIPDNSIFCLEDDDCAYMKKCTSVDAAQVSEEIVALRAATKGFELEKSITDQDRQQRAMDSLYRAERRIKKLRAYQSNAAAEQREKRARIGENIDLTAVEESPYQQLFEAIMAQNDFAKKQGDIIRFAEMYTVPGASEDSQMRRCKATDRPILPTFLVTLAEAFGRGTYTEELDQVCRLQGVLSDSGDTWVDKHSGYVIRTMEFDTTEGFDGEGYQIVSRDVLQQDIAEAVMQREYADSDSERISKIAKGFAGQIGVKLGDQSAFLVSEVRILLGELLPEKSTYEERAKTAQRRGKKIPPYEFAYDSMMLYLVICLTLVSVQSAVPAMKITRSFPGCKRSFTGYPLEGTADMTGLQYMACVASKLKSSSPPWNTIRSMKADALLKKLESTMTRVVKSRAVLAKLEAKREFMASNPEASDAIEPEYDVRQWETFLPPLVTPNVEPVRQLSDAFYAELARDVDGGKPDTGKGITLIVERTRVLSFGIQEAIQSVVSAFDPVLRTASGVPFLENACCTDGRETTVEFFKSKSPVLETYNRYAGTNMARYYKLHALAQAPVMHDPRNTRVEFPPVAKTASPEVIYKVLMHYCQYNKPTFLGDELKQLCGTREGPATDGLDPAETVATLKAVGIEYTDTELLSVMRYMAKENKLNTMAPPFRPPGEALREVVDNLPGDLKLAPELVDSLRAVFDMYGARLSDGKAQVDALRNVALSTSERLRQDIREFIRNNGGKLTPAGSAFLDGMQKWDKQPETWVNSSADTTASRVVLFTRDAVLSAGRSIPNIVANGIDYGDVPVPKAWGLSQRHVSDIKAFVAKQYGQLSAFYGINGIEQVCQYVRDNSKGFQLMQALTPLLPARGDVESVFNARVVTELNECYLLSVLELYILGARELDAVADIPGDPLSFEIRPDIGSSGRGGPSQLDNYRNEWKEQLTGREAENDAAAAPAVEIALSEVFDPRTLKQQTAKLLSAVIGILAEEKRIVDVGVEKTKERTLKAKEKEKDEITSYLRDLSDEERQAQDVLKNNRLGAWGKGHTKGLVHYVQDVYDEEVAALEQRAAIDLRLGERSEVTDMNRDIYSLEMHEQDLAAHGIQDEVDNLSALPDDDDYGDADGDEGY